MSQVHEASADRNQLRLWSNAPRWVHSTAPLAGADGKPVPGPKPGRAGHALYLNDQQVGSG
jgi:hypothetical protein